jgi:hypothetical protein
MYFVVRIKCPVVTYCTTVWESCVCLWYQFSNPSFNHTWFIGSYANISIESESGKRESHWHWWYFDWYLYLFLFSGPAMTAHGSLDPISKKSLSSSEYSLSNMLEQKEMCCLCCVCVCCLCCVCVCCLCCVCVCCLCCVCVCFLCCVCVCFGSAVYVCVFFAVYVCVLAVVRWLTFLVYRVQRTMCGHRWTTWQWCGLKY